MNVKIFGKMMNVNTKLVEDEIREEQMKLDLSREK